MTLNNATPFGGVWSSSNTSAATVSAAGFVKGTGAGISIISFTTNMDGCVATRAVTVNACREAAPGETGSVAAVSGSVIDVRLFPNPNSGAFSLRGSVDAIDGDNVSVEIVNMAGQVVYRSDASVKDGSIDKQIELNGSLSNGMYLLNMRTEKGNKLFHFIIQQ
jgi:hypothetical protein